MRISTVAAEGARPNAQRKSMRPARFFPEVVATLQEVPVERFVVDGELVIELNGRIARSV
jgi:hypothetical protein